MSKAKERAVANMVGILDDLEDWNDKESFIEARDSVGRYEVQVRPSGVVTLAIAQLRKQLEVLQ